MTETSNWTARFRNAWDTVNNPTGPLQRVGIPDDATPKQLADAWRHAIGPFDPQRIVLSYRETVRSTIENTVSDLHTAIIERVTSSDDEAGLVIAKDFGTSTGLLTSPADFEAPEHMVYAPLSALPEGHWLRSVLQPEECWRSSTHGPALVLGPPIAGTRSPHPFYLVEAVVSTTELHASHQREQARQHKLSEQRREEANRKAIEADPRTRMTKLERENAELRQRLEDLEAKGSE